jgi:hypothetical protein
VMDPESFLAASGAPLAVPAQNNEVQDSN